MGKTLLHPVIEPPAPVVQEDIRSQSSVDIHDTPSDSIEPLSAATIGSQKMFDFSIAKFTSPSGSLASGSNPFVFSSPTPSNPIFETPDGQQFDSTNPFDVKQIDQHSIKSADDVFDKVEGTSSEYGQSSTSFKDDEDKRCPMQSQFSQCLRSSSSSLSSQSNLGTTIAGVVGGGASKLQALQKWFKGDSFDGKDFSKKKADLSELASVSVRDLVKVIGGQDVKSNGNGSTPPLNSRSSSPVPVPSSRL